MKRKTVNQMTKTEIKLLSTCLHKAHGWNRLMIQERKNHHLNYTFVAHCYKSAYLEMARFIIYGYTWANTPSAKRHVKH